MEATLLNIDLEVVGFLDVFKSLLWTDKYDKFGEFEIIEFPSTNVLTLLSEAVFILIKESEHAMIIETLNIHTDAVNGNELIVKGKSLESILKRRIVWNPTVLTGDFQTAIELILDDNAINPTDTTRKITRLEFLASTDPAITDLTIDVELLGETLYDVISSLCNANGIGFKIVLTDLGKYQFQLYAGADRSYDQVINPYVVFSPSFDNLINGDYYISDENSKTVALVGGEAGVGNIRTFATVQNPIGTTELDRREIFVDSSGATRTSYQGFAPLTDEEYLTILENKGYEELANNSIIQTFDGQLEPNSIYFYGEDFFMGDILQVSNEYGHEAKSRVTEMVYFQDSSGTKTVPTFTAI